MAASSSPVSARTRARASGSRSAAKANPSRTGRGAVRWLRPTTTITAEPARGRHSPWLGLPYRLATATPETSAIQAQANATAANPAIPR